MCPFLQLFLSVSAHFLRTDPDRDKMNRVRVAGNAVEITGGQAAWATLSFHPYESHRQYQRVSGHQSSDTRGLLSCGTQLDFSRCCVFSLLSQPSADTLDFDTSRLSSQVHPTEQVGSRSAIRSISVSSGMGEIRQRGQAAQGQSTGLVLSPSPRAGHGGLCSGPSPRHPGCPGLAVCAAGL